MQIESHLANNSELSFSINSFEVLNMLNLYRSSEYLLNIYFLVKRNILSKIKPTVSVSHLIVLNLYHNIHNELFNFKDSVKQIV